MQFNLHRVLRADKQLEETRRALSLSPVSLILCRLVLSQGTHTHTHTRSITGHTHTHSSCYYRHSTVAFRYCLFPQTTWGQRNQKARPEITLKFVSAAMAVVVHVAATMTWALRSIHSSDTLQPLPLCFSAFSKSNQTVIFLYLNKSIPCAGPLLPLSWPAVQDWQPEMIRAAWSCGSRVDRKT